MQVLCQKHGQRFAHTKPWSCYLQVAEACSRCPLILRGTKDVCQPEYNGNYYEMLQQTTQPSSLKERPPSSSNNNKVQHPNKEPSGSISSLIQTMRTTSPDHTTNSNSTQASRTPNPTNHFQPQIQSQTHPTQWPAHPTPSSPSSTSPSTSTGSAASAAPRTRRVQTCVATWIVLVRDARAAASLGFDLDIGLAFKVGAFDVLLV